MVGRICTRSVFIADAEETVREAAQRMRKEQVGTLVVLDAERRPAGIVTDRDITLRCVAEGLDPETTQIGAVMTAPVLGVPEATPIEDAIRHMASASLKRFVVTDEAGRLAGILALDDVLELIAEESKAIGRLVRKR